MNTNPIAPRRIHNSSKARVVTSTHKTKKRVAAYCRVSTESELQEGSYEMQQAYYRDLISQSTDMELVAVYGDKGKTGRSITARPEFQQMIADCEAGKIDMILTKSISRFSRNVADCVETLRKLRTLGIPVLFEREGLNSMDVQGQMVLDLFAALAQEESNSISMNCRWALEQHNASGKPRFKPSYGYYKERGDWVWQIKEDEAKRVRMAFQMASEGYCIASIQRALNELEEQEGTGVTWRARRIRYMLTNINYTGDCLTNKTVTVAGKKSKVNEGEQTQYYIECHHEPLVDMHTFVRVQELLDSGELSVGTSCHAARCTEAQLT